MKQRLGLIAALGLDAYDLADRFPELPCERFASSGRWAWLRFDPDEAPGVLDDEAVSRRLARLRRLAMIVRAEPDEHWRLELRPPKGASLRLGFHRELDHPTMRPPGPDARLAAELLLDRLDDRLPTAFRTPEDVLAKTHGKPRGKGLEAVRKAQARRVGDFLRSLGGFGDGAHVRRVLAGADDPEEERAGPLGLLPKFLDAMGLGKALVDEDGTWRVGPSADSVATFDRPRPLYGIAPPAAPIAGGPVELPASDLGRFWLLSWYCETDSEVDILVTPPAGARVPLPKTEHWAPIHRRDGRAYVEVGWHPPGPRFAAYRSLGAAIAAAPPGTVVEFASGNASEADPDSAYAPIEAGAQRYVGTLTDRGTFRLTHASVPARPGDVLAAMEICRRLDEPRVVFEMPTEDDALAVVAMARSTDWFAKDEDLPRARGKSVAAANRRNALATSMMVFRRRFADGPWDTAAGQGRDEESHRDWETMIDRVGTTVGKALAAPAGDDVILQTERAVFRRADWSKMGVGVLDALSFAWGRAGGQGVSAPQTPEQKLEPVDREFSGLGFVPLGDVHCDRFGELYLRGYAGPEGDAFGCAIAGTFGQFAYEFVTRFSNGGALTTSTTPNLKDQKKRRIFKRSYPDLTPAALYAKHRKAVAELSSARVKPSPVEATIEGFCRAIDEYIEREM